MAAKDIEYRTLIFSFIDNVKPQPDVHKGKVGEINHIILVLIPLKTLAQLLYQKTLLKVDVFFIKSFSFSFEIILTIFIQVLTLLYT